MVPLALTGDDITPDKFTGFWWNGKSGLYIHPNIWHGAVIPIDDHAELLDRQGRVHARVSVDFAKEFQRPSFFPPTSARRFSCREGQPWGMKSGSPPEPVPQLWVRLTGLCRTAPQRGRCADYSHSRDQDDLSRSIRGDYGFGDVVPAESVLDCAIDQLFD